MILFRTRSGSFCWLVAHDIRLNWRRFVGLFAGAKPLRALAMAAAATLAMHALAWPAVPFLAEYFDGAATTPENRLLLGGLLVCVASWMIAQGLFTATRTLYDRGDLDLLYGSPLSPRRILAAKAIAIAMSSLGSVAVLALPIANVGAFRLGPHWLAVYPALAGLALLATTLSIIVTIALFQAFGPRRARHYAHLAGALIGGTFVLGAQVVALLPESVRNSVSFALAPSGRSGLLSSVIWLPVEAILGGLVACVGLLAAGIVAFAMASLGLGARFAQVSLEASGTPHEPRRSSGNRPVRFRSGPLPALRRKEWRLLVRDPSLFAQLGLQIVYTIPLAVVLARSGTLPTALALTPAIVVIASQIAASLAWIAVSGEDAPELIASAPVDSRSVDLAKLSAVALPVAVVTGLPAAGLALSSPRAAVIAFFCAGGASVSTALLNFWHPMPGNRRGMLRRHAQSKLIGLLEHVLAILWAVISVLALVGAILWLVPLAFVVMVLAHDRIARWLGAGGQGRPLAPSLRESSDN